jgi:hypothetical protein
MDDMNAATAVADATVEAGGESTSDVVKSKTKRGLGYTRTEDLLLCRAFIKASENSKKGTGQKGRDFNRDVHLYYCNLLDEQEHLARTSYSLVVGRDAAALPGDNPPPQVYDWRTATAMMECFRKHIVLWTMKFIGVKVTAPKPSGTDKELQYKHYKDFFQRRNPKAPDFDQLRQCKEYLQDKAKWISYAAANNKEEKTPRPIGTKKDKKLTDDNKLIEKAIAITTGKVSETKFGGSSSQALNNNNIDATKFYTSATTAMEAFVHVMNDRTQTEMIKGFPTPQRKLLLAARADVMLARMQKEAAELQQQMAQINASSSHAACAIRLSFGSGGGGDG